MLLDSVMYITYIQEKQSLHAKKLVHKGVEFCSRNTLKLTYGHI
jgi:hypothetical protein